VQAHQPQDPLAADREASMSQARPHLAIALALEGCGRQHEVNRGQQLDVARRRLGPRFRGGRSAGLAGFPVQGNRVRFTVG
jgi:hypothetical protein